MTQSFQSDIPLLSNFITDFDQSDSSFTESQNKYSFLNASKNIGSGGEQIITIKNSNAEKEKNWSSSKIFLNAIERGQEAYQRIGNKIELLDLELQIRSIDFTDQVSDSNTLNLNANQVRAVRVCLVYSIKDGETSYRLTRNEIYCGFKPDESNPDPKARPLIVPSFHAQISPVYLDSFFPLYDRTCVLGAICKTNATQQIESKDLFFRYPVIRSNGNMYINERIPLNTLKTEFYVEDQKNDEKKFELFNISSGSLMVYLVVDFSSDNDVESFVTLGIEWKLHYSDASTDN